MKFQKLSIHNIASIKDALIEFDQAPLSNSEVFLISGKTGAGKSTILDAICLALYAQTPRMQNTKMQGGITEGTKDIKVSDPRQLMHRGSAECYASLTFVGNNSHKYEATWSVSRARKKVEGTLQSKSWELKDLDSGTVLTKDKEIGAEILVATGLDFSQFCRTTLLAQGEFTRFLNSTDDDKSMILEKITGVDIYSKIGAKVYGMTSDRDRLWQEAQKVVDDTHVLSAEELSKRRDELSSLDTQLEELNASKTTETGRRDCMSKVLEADAERQRREKELEDLSREYAEVLWERNVGKSQIGSYEEQLSSIGEFLSSESPRADMYAHAQTIEGHLTTLSQGRVTIADKKKDISMDEKTLQEQLIPAYTKASADSRAAHEAFEAEEAALKTQEDEIEALGLKDLRDRRDSLNDLLSKISTARTDADTLTRRQKVYADLMTRRSEIETKKERSKQMDGPIALAEARMNTCEEDLARIRDSIALFKMRHSIHQGDSCPVCGHIVESEPSHEDELATTLDLVQQKAYDEAKGEYERKVKAKVALDAEISSESKSYRRDFNTYTIEGTKESAQQALCKSLSDCGLHYDSPCEHEAILSALQTLSDSTTASLNELLSQLQSGESRETVVKSSRRALEGRRPALQKLDKEMSDAERAVSACGSRISAAQAVIETKDRDAKSAEAILGELIVSTSWGLDWQSEPDAFALALNSAAGRYNEAVTSKGSLSSQLATARVNLDGVNAAIHSILSARPSWSTIEPQQSSLSSDDLLARAGTLSTSVSTATSHLSDALKSIDDNANRLKDEYKEEGETTEERLAEVKAVIDDIEAKITSINLRKGAIGQELESDSQTRVRLETLKVEAADRKSDYDRWSRLNALIGDSTGKRFRTIAQSYVLADLIRSANYYMESLSDRYKLRVVPGSFTIMLEDAYQGYASRAASTISGGESFLVSLSLALALSDIDQGLSVDTLFIDEGFGTLSGDPLQKAINTLQDLHSTSGRKVGIISHVDELREHIHVQIRVNQQGGSSSSTVETVVL